MSASIVVPTTATTIAAPAPMMSSMMMPQPMLTQPTLGFPTAQSMVAVPNYEYVLPSGGVIAPGGGADYQSASGSYYFQPNTPFVFYPEEPNASAKGDAKRDVKVSKKSKKKKKSCGLC